MELGKKAGLDLTGYMKIKLRKDGLRIVYKLERTETTMKIVIIGMRSDLEVYKDAVKRTKG